MNPELKLFCYICGKEIEGQVVLCSMQEKTIKPFLADSKCSEGLSDGTQVRMKVLIDPSDVDLPGGDA